MTRRNRLVIPGAPHHITQRGVRKQDIFFCDTDRVKYKELLLENCLRYGVEVIGYGLMSNHVHHLLVPLEADSLRWTLQYTHKRYADYLNGKNGWSGHAWQEKFYSSPVDSRFFWVTLRYIEQNPLKAGMVKHAAQYRWSSAAYHCGLVDDPLITKAEKWRKIKDEVKDWCEWLSENDDEELISRLRKNTLRDLPSGSEDFLDRIEDEMKVSARPTKMGRPRKVVKS